MSKINPIILSDIETISEDEMISEDETVPDEAPKLLDDQVLFFISFL